MPEVVRSDLFRNEEKLRAIQSLMEQLVASIQQHSDQSIIDPSLAFQPMPGT